MKLSPVLSPMGEPIYAVGGRHAYKTFSHRGWNISLEWMGEGKRQQPCMVIWPETNVFTQSVKPGAWTIGRRALFEFVGFDANGKATGSASQHCYRECMEALPILGKDRNDKQAFLSLVDCVITYAPELHHMPVAPRQVREDIYGERMWEVQAINKDTGKVMAEGEA